MDKEADSELTSTLSDSKYGDDSSYPPQRVLEEASDDSDAQLLADLYDEVRKARKHFDNYCLLFSFTFYTVVYMAILYLHARSSETFHVAQAHNPLLPPDYTSDGGNTFSSSDDIYQWLNDSIIQAIWTNTECGNGICDRPQETPSYGPDNRLGCASDCGVFEKTTPFFVAISTSFKSATDQGASSWNLCMKSPMEFCWYEKDQTFAGDLASYKEVTMNLPDGNWTVKLNAPNGGVASVGNYGSKLDSDNRVFSFGLGCTDPADPSPFTLCRAECEAFLGCYLEECPSTPSETFLSHFGYCLTLCGVKEETENTTKSLKAQSCSQKIKSLVGKENVCVEVGSEGGGLALPTNTTAFPTDLPRAAYKALLWEKLGSSDDDRLFRLSSAVQRGLYTWIKDECLVTTPKPTAGGQRLTAFLCTFLGGPTNLTACRYTSNGSLLQTDEELFTEMHRVHKSLGLSEDQQSRFSEVLLWALQSVALLEDATVAQLYGRLRQLDQAIVLNTQGPGCNKATNYIPVSLNSASNILDRYIAVGGSVQWVWEDDKEHSIASSGEGTLLEEHLEGFGSGKLILSRGTVCTRDNIGEGARGPSPTPCNLVDPKSAPPHPFKYTYLLSSNGTFSFSSGRVGDTVVGTVYVYNSRENSTEPVCSSACHLSSISNGKCDPACNNPECTFDGGDCSCPADEFGQQVCSCPSGQTRGYSGECCDDASFGSVSREFQVLNYSREADPAVTNADILTEADVALIRTTAKLNRVLIGLLVDQKRQAPVPCDKSETRFTSLQSLCLSGTSESPFGVSPQTLLSSSLYDKAYLDAVSDIYAKNGSFRNETLAFNSRGIPYGFYPTVVEGRSHGFSYLFDINLDNSQAGKLLGFLKDGFFIDNSTSSLRARLATYNGEARLFSLVLVEANVEDGGRIAVKADVKSLSVEHYATAGDWGRLVLELVFLLCLAVDILGEVHEYFAESRKSKSIFSYFASIWNWIDLLSIAIMVMGVILWVYNVVSREQPFKVQPRYNVYDSALTSFTYWKLQDPPAGIQDALRVFEMLSDMSDFRSYFLAIQGINVFLMILRLLELMDFQPRLGTITRTFTEAAPDLLHFFIVWTFIFGAFTFFAHIVFGRLVDQFRTFGAALNACFRIIMGQDSAADFLFQLAGWELAAGVIFWWTFIAIVVFVVMNVLIAIIVDSYASVKGKEAESNPKSLPEDVFRLLRNLSNSVAPGKFSLMQQLRVLQKLGAEQREDNRGTFFAFGGSSRVGDPPQKVFRIKEQEVEQETLVSLLRRAQDRKGIPELGKHKRGASGLVEDMAENLTVQEISEQVQQATDDVKEMKESLARLESPSLSANMESLERSVARLYRLMEAKFGALEE